MIGSLSLHRGLVSDKSARAHALSLDIGALRDPSLQGLECVGRLRVLCGALLVLLESILGVASKQFVDRLDEASASGVLSRVLDGQT